MATNLNTASNVSAMPANNTFVKADAFVNLSVATEEGTVQITKMALHFDKCRAMNLIIKGKITLEYALVNGLITETTKLVGVKRAIQEVSEEDMLAGMEAYAKSKAKKTA